MMPTTPTGSRRTATWPPNDPTRRSSHWTCSAAAANASSAIIVAPTCPTWENQSGAPISVLMRVAISSCRAA
jgi:hypothetical protein